MADERSNIKTFPGSGTTPPARVMPHNLQAEQNLLGAIQNRVLGVGLFDDNKRLIGSLPAEAFYTQIKSKTFAMRVPLVW